MKTVQIAIYVFLPICLLATGCGRKLPPKPEEGSTITYPKIYPHPEEGECPPSATVYTHKFERKKPNNEPSLHKY